MSAPRKRRCGVCEVRTTFSSRWSKILFLFYRCVSSLTVASVLLAGIWSSLVDLDDQSRLVYTAGNWDTVLLCTYSKLCLSVGMYQLIYVYFSQVPEYGCAR